MKEVCFFIFMILLSGCASKMAYLNTQKPAEELQKDKADCQSIVDASDFKDPGLQKKKFDQCMQDKGYNVVSEDRAEKIQGFKELWIKTGADFNGYEAIFIDKVDLSQVKVENNKIPNNKVTDEDINKLGDEMLKRFSKTVNVIIPVVADKEELAGKKVLYTSLKLNSISETNVGLSAALGVAGHFSPLPLPSGPEGTFSFQGTIFDSSGKEKLITFSDEVKADKNSSLAGVEKFSHWQKAYNVMDYWADKLAQLLAKERGQEYKSQLGMKIL
ncbi:MAG: DUF3313 family protein [Candidatus Omnitrophica bacterium]|nr:DUF3313 family protein [Candidatus Omnitrophota bacterium]